MLSSGSSKSPEKESIKVEDFTEAVVNKATDNPSTYLTVLVKIETQYPINFARALVLTRAGRAKMSPSDVMVVTVDPSGIMNVFSGQTGEELISLPLDHSNVSAITAFTTDSTEGKQLLRSLFNYLLCLSKCVLRYSSNYACGRVCR